MKKVIDYINSLHKTSVKILLCGLILALVYFITGIIIYINRMRFDDLLWATECYKTAISSCCAMCIVALIGAFASDIGFKYVDRR